MKLCPIDGEQMQLINFKDQPIYRCVRCCLDQRPDPVKQLEELPKQSFALPVRRERIEQLRFF